ncbi:hypothetical protein A0256_22640 [Mucilaginibacter sp. PAMC 26640]|nr:hypothetical protein A0256_22640 [Mucilaginibacter sp. PAMC 26640]
MINRRLLYLITMLLPVAVYAFSFGKPLVKSQLRIAKPLVMQNVHDRVISNLDITGKTVDCIKLSNCRNITIKSCRLRYSVKNGVSVLNCSNVTIVDCYFEKVATGVYALSSKAVLVNHNQFKNMCGPFPRGQFVQFDSVSGPDNQINYNTCENLPGQSHPEDAINLYKTYGTEGSPVQVTGNRIRGGGPSKTGGGIMLGDYGGGYILATNNILVNPGQYGMAIAGGNNISMINNTIYGRRQPFTNVGIYIWNQHAAGCSLNTISGNKIRWTSAKGENNPGWNQGNCSKTSGWSTNIFNAKIKETILPQKLID